MVICQICKKKFKSIGHNHLKTHGVTVKEYKLLYPNHKMISDSTMEKYKLHTKKLVKEGIFGSQSSKTHLFFLHLLRQYFPDVKFESEYTIKYYTVDIVCVEKKLAIEVNGDWFHNKANKPYDELTPIQKKNCKNDKSKSTFLHRKGWNQLILWESDIKNSAESQIKIVSDFLKKEPLPNVHFDLKKKCKQCGECISPNKNNYYSENKKYCSNRCKNKALLRSRDDNSEWRVHCKQCGKELTSRRNRSFCDTNCQKRYESEESYREQLHQKISKSIKDSEYHKNRRINGRVDLVCDCGNEFWVHKKRLKMGGNIWCSRECYIKYH